MPSGTVMPCYDLTRRNVLCPRAPLTMLLTFRRRRKKPVHLQWFRYLASPHGNFGDEITPLLIEREFHRRVVWATFNECDLIGAGSIMDVVPANIQDNRPLIWGTGFMREGPIRLPYDAARLVSVRGRTTLSRIDGVPQDANIVLGDPGLLANRLIDHPIPKRYAVGLIPHYVDHDAAMAAITETGLVDDKRLTVISPLDRCEDVIAQIASCETILSSSLHGLIAADSLSIPNLHIRFTDKVVGGLYKFHDYYSVFDEPRYDQASSDILRLGANEIAARIDEKFVRPDHLTEIQERIAQAFPDSLL